MRQRIVGLDIIEIATKLDHANAITCITAGRVILTALGASWVSRARTARATNRATADTARYRPRALRRNSLLRRNMCVRAFESSR